MLWAEVALALVSTMIPYETEVASEHLEEFWANVLIAAAILGLSIWFNIRIWQGRNWARWVILSITAATLLAYPMIIDSTAEFGPDFLAYFDQRPIGTLVDLAGLALDVVALTLIFGPGRAWFRARS